MGTIVLAPHAKVDRQCIKSTYLNDWQNRCLNCNLNQLKLQFESVREDSRKNLKSSARETVKRGYTVPRNNIKYETRLFTFNIAEFSESCLPLPKKLAQFFKSGQFSMGQGQFTWALVWPWMLTSLLQSYR